MAEYRTVLFDLDHTLWDYDTNSRETLQDMFGDFGLSQRLGTVFGPFHDTFEEINTDLWTRYDQGLIPRETIRKDRFRNIIGRFGVDDPKLSEKLSDAYVERSPKRSVLIDGAMDILQYLQPRYELFIVTNGFEEVQLTKVRSSGIGEFFREIIISDRVGHKKPSPLIFDHVLDKYGYERGHAVMIGDNLLTDIAGARNAGIDTVFYNPKETPHGTEVTHEIRHLRQLQGIL